MGRFTKRHDAAHREAQRLVAVPRELSEHEKIFVLDHWQPAAPPSSFPGPALFTPSGLAREFALQVIGSRVIDLGAGIGALGFACHRMLMHTHRDGGPLPDIVCVEQNPELVRVGLRVLPEAVWICADLLRVPRMRLRHFDTAVAHPPYGAAPRLRDSPTYRGYRFEYHTIAVAAQVAAHGVFLVPRQSVPFTRSGTARGQAGVADAEYTRFSITTGIRLAPAAGVDTDCYRFQWQRRPPATELVVADFTDPTVLRPARPANISRFDAGYGR